MLISPQAMEGMRTWRPVVVIMVTGLDLLAPKCKVQSVCQFGTTCMVVQWGASSFT